MGKNCNGCKHWKQGLSIDYVPGYYCDVSVEDKEHCTRYNEPYNFFDWIAECWIGVLMVIGILTLNLMSTCQGQ